MTQSFFDDSHVTDIGLQGSLGPSVGLFDMVQQGFRQQYRVDSAFALDAELDSRWRESLRALSDAGQQFNFRGGNPYVMRDFARYIREGTVPQGQRVVLSQEAETMGEARLESANDDFEEMRRANEAIRQLNNPNIRTFEQILEEVSAMQRDVEQETASMSERGGWSGFFGELFGAIGGSFTVRDPLNLFTAGFGAGRTVATRIAAEMGIAGGITAVTEYGDVAPNRALAELPERSSIFNITAAALGAGIIRGGFEAIGAGIRATPAFQQRAALRELESLDFDARDTSLRALLETLPESPRARAAASALDDTIFIERNNPYGEGQAASVRFLAELQDVQRAMNGEPMTAIARALPPMPFEFIQRQGDFVLVKEQQPLLYARMEQAQARLQDLTQQVNRLVEQDAPDIIETVRLIDNEAADQLQQLSVRVNDEAAPEAARVAADIEAQAIIQRIGVERIMKAADAADTQRRADVRNLRASRRAANKEYREVYRQVENEAVRLREEQTRIEAAQQREAVGIFADATQGRPFNWSVLQYDHVQARIDAINALSDTLDNRAAETFVRTEAVSVPQPIKTAGMVTVYRAGTGVKGGWFTTSREYAEQIAERDGVPLWEAEVSRDHEIFSSAEEVGDPNLQKTYQADFSPNEISNARQIAGASYFTEDGRIDIGLREPVDPEFRVATDDGEMSIADIMRDLQDDADLDEAMRICLR